MAEPNRRADHEPTGLSSDPAPTSAAFRAAETNSLIAVDPDSTQAHVSSGAVTTATSSAASSGSAARFEIVRLHAKGGLGEVFVASDRELNREVALKQIQARLADYGEARARFLLEAEITGTLEHPGIVPVYSLGAYPNGNPFYAMRFIRGQSLAEAAQHFHSEQQQPAAERSVEFRKLLARFVSVCQAIAYAHSRGVLHRDLKPDNIMLGEYGETLVVDWGLAKVLGKADTAAGEPLPGASESATKSGSLPPLQPRTPHDLAGSQQGQIVGTPAYMSPEQADGKLGELGPATDIYSLGATLYTLLTGERPIPGKSKQEVIDRVRAGRIPRPASLSALVPLPLEAVCLKAMSLSPAARYASARALADDVDRWLADEPVQAYAEPLAARARRWIRKHPGPVAALAATVVLGLFGAGAVAILTSQHARELTSKNTTITQQNSELVASNRTITKQKTDLEQQNATITRQKSDLEQTNIKLVEARNLAQKEQAQAEGVTEFLVSSFRKVDPEQDGKQLTVYEVLTRAKKEIAARRDIDPLQQAELLHAFGQSFLGLGLFTDASAAFGQEREITTEKLGPEHRRTLESMNSQAAGFVASKDWERALPLLEETLRLRQEFLGPDDPDTLTSMNNLGVNYRAIGKLDESLSLLTKALAMTEAKLGPDHPSTLACRHNLCASYNSAGMYREALAMTVDTLRLCRTSLGDDHPNTLRCMHSLASNYRKSGQLDQALSLMEEALRLRRAKLGDDHPDTLINMSSLADMYRESGRLNESLALFKEVLEHRQTDLGGDQLETLQAEAAIALAYQVVGQHEFAVPLHEKVLRIKRERLGDDHEETLSSQSKLASALREAGRLDEALPLLVDTLRRFEKKHGQNHPDTMFAMNNLADARLEVGQAEHAVILSTTALGLMKERLGEDHPHTLVCQNNLARAYHALGQPKLALPIYETSLRISQAKLGDDHPQTLSSMHGVAACLFSTGKVDEAVTLIEKTWQLRKAKLGEGHPETLNSLNNFAAFQTRLRRFEVAIPLHVETLRLRKEHLGADHPETLHSMNNLASAFRESGDLDQAIPLFAGCLERRKARLGKDHPDTLGSYGNLASTLFVAGQAEKALPVFQEHVDVLRAKSPPNDMELAGLLTGGSQVLMAAKQFAAAEPFLRESLAIRQAVQPDLWPTFYLQTMLGNSLLGQKKYEEAEKSLVAGHEGLEQRRGKLSEAGKKKFIESVERLVDLYTAWEKPNELEKWQAKLKEVKSTP